tara:strand:+ start:295 stop:510 length:216 start_codon:yes stop_codon:yes gene_type:complete
VIILEVKLKLTKHAKEQMINRGIEKEQIKDVIRMGNKIKQTDGFLSCYGYIAVAWKKTGEYYKIKTVIIRD